MSDLVDAAIARLQGLFVEPAGERIRAYADGPPVSTGTPPVNELELALIGLSHGCGGSTVAVGLALALAESGRPTNLITLAGGDPAERGRLGRVRVWQLPPALLDPGEVAQYGGVVARISGGRGMGAGSSATIWDVPAGSAERAAVVLGELELVVAVAGGDADPALAELATEMIGERTGRALLVANRCDLDADWQGRAAACVPESRVGARAIRRGRMPGGATGTALRRLAAAVEFER